MLTDGFAVVSKFSSKFLHEVLPVALASVIGTLIVNHYSMRPAATPIVVKAEPPPGGDEIMKTLRDERAIIADYLKRDAEPGGGKTDSASTANLTATAFSTADPPEPPVRRAVVKKPARPQAKPAQQDKKAAVAASITVPTVVEPADFVEPSAAPAASAQGERALDGLRSLAVNALQWSTQPLAPPFVGRLIGPWGPPGGGPRFN